MQHCVDLRGSHDALEDRVLRVGAHERAPFEWHPRLARIEAHHHFDVVAVLELERELAAPERRKTGDQNPHALLTSSRGLIRTTLTCDAAAGRRARPG